MFSEARPLVEVGRRGILNEKDLLPLPTTQVPENLSGHLQGLDFSSGPALIWSNLRSLGWKFRKSFLFFLVSLVMGLSTPVLVNHFIQLLNAASINTSFYEYVGWGLALGFVTMAQGILMQHYFYGILGCEQITTRVLNRRVYLHSLRLSNQARGRKPIGDIVNHMSTDSDGVSEFVFVLPELAEVVLTILGATALLFYYLGWTALAPLVLFAVLVPLTKKLGGRFTHLDDEMMRWRDRRVSLMTQILSAIRIVKYFVWEKSVFAEVNELRQKELQARKKMAQTEVLSSAAYTSVTAIVLFVTLALHILRGGTLDVALVFTCISLFGLVEHPLGHMSNIMSRWTTSFVGSARLVAYLKEDTFQSAGEIPVLTGKPAGFRLDHVTIAYDPQQEPVLKNLQLNIPPGSSVAVVGAVGSGKSTLLLSLLEELVPVKGTINEWSLGEEGDVARRAFCPQEAYIVNGSLAENLSFGSEVLEDEVHQALKVTALEQDLRLFPAGLNTEIGEKGVNLSGGQKQRVALARAVLAKPGVVLLDDPLSAVDVETEKHLVDHLLFGVWKNVTRVVATHRMESLARFDQVVFLKDGGIAAVGNYTEVMGHPDFVEFYSAHRSIQDSEKTVNATVTSQEKKETESRITDDEEREVGAVKSSVYWDYVLSLGGVDKNRQWNLVLLFLGATAVVLLPLAQKAWLSMVSRFQDPLQGVGIYGLLGLLTLAVTAVSGLFWLRRGVEAGRYMHDAMLKSILGAPLRFFDATPVGRILQRFSRDIESVDVYLQWTFNQAIYCFLQVLVTLFLIASVLPVTLAVMLPMLLAYYILQRDYRRPAREAKRLDSLARSPRYAHFKETLMGLSVIRGFRREEWFLESFRKKLFKSQETFYNTYLLNRWFSVRIPLLGGSVAAATIVFLSVAVHNQHITAGTGGLLVIYSLSFWSFLNWGVRIFSDMESRMTSIERLKFYSNLTPEKGHALDQPARVNAWPSRGILSFENVSVRYAKHLPLVLKNVNFEVGHGERIGLIGRTGSGKSTLLQSLFRFVDLEGGKILLDGRDIHDVSLPELRRSLAIIPQDPILFMGTLRSNLDRYNQYSDHQVEQALRAASMWSFISALPQGMGTAVTENGSNLSQGQRQLLCLARALLVRAKVVALDEATASVDVQTDVTIQKVIRESLKDVTLLIIAHRLGTVMDCDRIIELSQGEVKDVWSPAVRKKNVSIAEL